MKHFVLPALFLVVTLSACSRSGRGPEFEPDVAADVVARVNGAPITATELAAWAGRGRQGDTPDDEQRAKALEALITREILRQEAYKLGLHRDAETASKLAALRAQYMAAQREVLGAAFNGREQAQAAAVSEADARGYFDAHAAELRTEYHLMQIAYAKDPAAIAGAKRALDEGTPFETVAARRFAGLPPEQRPWDLGFLKWGQLPSEWREEAAKLAPGSHSGIIKGAGDRWWIIHLVEKRVNESITFESERQVLTAMLQNERMASARGARLEALRKGADVEYVKR